MTVRELIKMLKRYDEDLDVVISVDGYTLDLDDAFFREESWETKRGEEVDILDIKF